MLSVDSGPEAGRLSIFQWLSRRRTEEDRIAITTINIIAITTINRIAITTINRIAITTIE